MPKCDNCMYLTKEGYEYPEYYCAIFDYDTPEKYQTKYGDGCKCTKKYLAKLYNYKKKQEQEYWEKYNSKWEEMEEYEK